MYGDFNSQKILDAKTDNKLFISGDLINFHDINADYITNRPDKNNILTMNSIVSPWFNTDAYNSQFDTKKNADERVSYFPTFINTPIDIAYSRNQSYFLLPLSNNRYTNLVQSENTLHYRNQGPDAIYKPNYSKMYEYQWSKPFYYAEDNSVPIYDLNFSNIETIDLQTNENVILFLKENNLLQYKVQDELALTESYISAQVIFDSNLNTIAPKSGTCILLKRLLEIFVENSYLFNTQRVKTIVQDLISRIEASALIRLLTPIGNITKLNNDVISRIFK